LGGAADIIKSQAKRIEEFREARELSRTNGRILEGAITRLQADNAKLKERIMGLKYENSTMGEGLNVWRDESRKMTEENATLREALEALGDPT
jgi:predicted nuclease with TOPRIM domain